MGKKNKSEVLNDVCGRSYVLYNGEPMSVTSVFFMRYDSEFGFGATQRLVKKIAGFGDEIGIDIVASPRDDGLIVIYNPDGIAKHVKTGLSDRVYLEMFVADGKENPKPVVSIFSDAELRTEKVTEDIVDEHPIPQMYNGICRRVHHKKH